MKITYFDGSFMLSWDKCRAWFHPDGTLKDCEYVRHTWRLIAYSVAIPMKHHKVRSWLGRQGAKEVTLPSHAGQVERAKRAHEQRMAGIGLPLPHGA